jgi:para-aminobenzoate synthetase / 4-amino-4-deoxychorismate lyase
MQRYAQMSFENPVDVIEAFDYDGLAAAFQKIEQAWQSRTLLGYIRYEAKNALLDRAFRSKLPLLYFEVHQTALPMTPAVRPCVPLTAIPSLDFATYRDALLRIKEEIAEGNTYQVNYTYDSHLWTPLAPLDLYEMLLPRQTTPYTAFIENQYESILSFSPELFFEIEGRNIRAKPMKGTASRGKNSVEDDANRIGLQDDAKNRSENVMIVDLLRNDLGKVATPGSVKVTQLFDVETHSTLHQMTSEIVAELNPSTSLWGIFKALFPCGSVTGAPKRSTMAIIDALEKGPRGVYCGAIAFLQPGRATFSVPIRILQRTHDETDYRYRVGSGIVWDSDPQEEWLETQTKTAFLQGDYQLLETIRVTDGVWLYGPEHLARMEQSATALGFPFQKPSMTGQHPDGILRLLLARDGTFTTELHPDKGIHSTRVAIALHCVASFEPLLRHKTTYRPWYTESLEKIRTGELFDELFLNERGEVTEGSRSNLFAQINGVLYTPPLACGLLNGILRQKLLDDGKCQERCLRLDDLQKAGRLFCGNSVRGLVEVQLDSINPDSTCKTK